MNVMIIDDEPKIRKGISRLIEAQEGWDAVASFADAESALRYLYENEVDAIITDIQMPGKSGLDMIDEIRRVNRDIPIVIISGYCRFDYAQRAIEQGVRKYLTKPSSPNEIKETLMQIENELKERFEETKEKVEHNGLQMPVNNLLILRAIEYIQNNFQNKLTLHDVAAPLFISPNYLSELFKKTTHVCFSDFLQNVRMEKAAQYLQDVSLKVSAVAELTGFSDVRYFSSAFKKQYGMTPLAYRNSEQRDKRKNEP